MDIFYPGNVCLQGDDVVSIPPEGGVIWGLSSCKGHYASHIHDVSPVWTNAKRIGVNKDFLNTDYASKKNFLQIRKLVVDSYL